MKKVKFVDLKQIAVGNIWVPIMSPREIDILIQKGAPSVEQQSMWQLFDYSLRKSRLIETTKEPAEHIFEGWEIVK